MRSPTSRVTATTNFGDGNNRSRSGPPVGVAGGDAPFAEFGQYGGVVDAQVFAYSGEGPAEVVEVDRVVDLLGGESTAAHRHVVSFENVADRPPFDAEPIAQLIHRRSGLVTGDEFLDLVGIELACPPWFGALDGQRSRFGGVWQLPEQRLQGFYVGFVL
jgi:hypothetical protein